jgi:hypothetical protein
MRWKFLLILALVVGALSAGAVSAAAVTVTPGGSVTLSGGQSRLVARSGALVWCNATTTPAPPPYPQQLVISATGVPSGSFYMAGCGQFRPDGTPIANTTVACTVNGGSTTFGLPIRMTFNVTCKVAALCAMDAIGTITFDYDNNGTLRPSSTNLTIPSQSALCVDDWRGPARLTWDGNLTLSPRQVVSP